MNTPYISNPYASSPYSYYAPTQQQKESKSLSTGWIIFIIVTVVSVLGVIIWGATTDWKFVTKKEETPPPPPETGVEWGEWTKPEDTPCVPLHGNCGSGFQTFTRTCLKKDGTCNGDKTKQEKCFLPCYYSYENKTWNADANIDKKQGNYNSIDEFLEACSNYTNESTQNPKYCQAAQIYKDMKEGKTQYTGWFKTDLPPEEKRTTITDMPTEFTDSTKVGTFFRLDGTYQKGLTLNAWRAIDNKGTKDSNTLYYTGIYDKEIDFSNKGVPLKDNIESEKLITQTVDNKPIPIYNEVLMEFTGFIKVPVSRIYKFTVTCDDGAKLSINNKILLDGWGEHPKTDYSKEIYLESGVYYPFKLEYYEWRGGAILQLKWDSDDKGEKVTTDNLVPPMMFYHYEK